MFSGGYMLFGTNAYARLRGVLNADVLYTIGSRLVVMVAGFASAVLTARFLGPAGRGEYYYVVTFAALLSQFGNLGLQSSNTYFVAGESSSLGGLAANSALVSLLLGGLLPAGVILLTAELGWIGSAHWLNLLIGCVLASATLFFLLGSNLLVGINRIKLFNNFQLAGNFGVLLAILIAAWVHAGVRGFLIAIVTVWLMAALGLLVVVRNCPHGTLRPSFSLIRRGFCYATKAYLVALLGFLVLRGNVFLLQHFHGAKELGYYSVASQISDILGILPASVALVLFPRLVRSTTDAWLSTLRNLGVISVLLLLGIIVAALLAYPFIGLTFGKTYQPSVVILFYMLPSALFLGMASIVSQYLAAMGFPKLLVFVWAFDLLIMAGSGYLLIPRLAGIGAAVSLSIAHACVLVMLLALGFITHRRGKFSAGATIEERREHAF